METPEHRCLISSEEAEEEPYKPLGASLSARQPHGPLSASVTLSYNHYAKQINSMTSRLKADFRKVSLTLGQSYVRSSEIETYSAEGRIKTSDRTQLFAGIKYDEAEENDLEETSAGVLYQSQCWGMELTYIRKPDDYSIYVKVTLLGIGGVGIN